MCRGVVCRYAPVAQQGATAFFVVAALQNLTPMYAFSVQWFHAMFVRAVQHSAPSNDLDTRLSNLRTFLLELLFRQVISWWKQPKCPI